MKILKLISMMLCVGLLSTSCLNDGKTEGYDSLPVLFGHKLPEGVSADDVVECTLFMTELNTGAKYGIDLLTANTVNLPLGIFDFEGTAKVNSHASDGSIVVKTLRVSAQSVPVTDPTAIELAWFFSNPGGSLVFSEIYGAGSPNATATGSLRDSYLRIYNNTDETIYADGLAICESAFVNARNNTFEILTPANDREKNFTAATIWVIPGSGTDYPIPSGGSIKLVDQAIDWSAQVPGALNHTDADFEWVDDNPQDTDNPQVPNLEKWFCYSNSIWMMTNQCNRSYALARIPEGMTAEQYLVEYKGSYEYIHTTGAYMSNDKAYLIPNEWILDGVNMGDDATYVIGALGKGVDISYASISDVNKDPNRFGYKFQRRVSAALANGKALLLDTNDSAVDFARVKAVN